MTDHVRSASRSIDLRALEERYATLVAYSPVCIHELDLEGRILSMNPTGLRMLGVERFEEIEGTSYFDLIREADRSRVLEKFRRSLAGEETHFEFEASGPNPGLEISSNFIPIFGSEAEVCRLMGISEDVTERNRSQRLLKQSEERYRTIVEEANVGYILTDDEGKIIEVNEALCRLLCQSRSEILGRTPCGMSDEDGAAQLQHRVTQGEDESPVRPIIRLHREDGSSVLVRFDMTILKDGHGGGLRSFSIVTDVTEAPQRDQELFQAQKLEVVGRLTGGVAHDFNNLLAIIVGNVELFGAKYPAADPAQKKIVSNIHDAALRGAALTQQLLAFSRRQVLAPQTVELGNEVDRMLVLLRRTLGELHVLRSEHPSLRLDCLADVGQLENVVLNLVLNARDAMPEGGTISISTSAVSVSEIEAVDLGIRAGEYASLSICDTGTGMTEAVRQRAFEPFFTTKTAGRGTGLGLSMAFGFARQSDGHVSLRNRGCGGLEVRLLLPQVETRCLEHGTNLDEVAVQSVHRGEGECVLVVEDSPELLMVTSELLRLAGYEVIEADCGEQAIDVLQSSRPVDVVLSDVMMPGLSGHQVVAEAKRIRPRIVALLMTGHVKLDSGARESGVPDVPILRKPLAIDELLDQIRIGLKAVNG